MKIKKTGSKILAFFLIILIFSFSAFPAFAVEGEGEDEGEIVISDEVPEQTEAEQTTPIETQAEEPETEYVPETEPEPETEYEPETEAETDDVQDETDAPVETFAVLDNNLDDLPEADTAPSPTAPKKKSTDKSKDFTYGIVSWVCVAIGLIAVFIVIISNKSHYYGGGGKHRYDEGDKITGQKRLLNDEFYNNRKQSAYRNKDTRR